MTPRVLYVDVSILADVECAVCCGVLYLQLEIATTPAAMDNMTIHFIKILTPNCQTKATQRRTELSRVAMSKVMMWVIASRSDRRRAAMCQVAIEQGRDMYVCVVTRERN